MPSSGPRFFFGLVMSPLRTISCHPLTRLAVFFTRFQRSFTLKSFFSESYFPWRPLNIREFTACGDLESSHLMTCRGPSYRNWQADFDFLSVSGKYIMSCEAGAFPVLNFRYNTCHSPSLSPPPAQSVLVRTASFSIA